MRRVTVAIDVDGVIADFVETVRHEWGLYESWEPTSFNICEDPTFRSYNGHTPRAFAEWCARRPIARDLRPYASEVRALKEIMTRHAQRAEFVFVTSPMHSNRTWTHDREAWLHDQGFGDVPVIHTHRKDLVDADVLLDDKPEHVIAFAQRRAGRAGVLRVRPWNESAPRPRTPQVYYAESMCAFGAYLDEVLT